ncbi:MAG TPA: SMP-30/gluconolactonase/LRE family protein, partial [Thermoleophilaceae bacterium]|nr:SMP-30/gluconolactonase/LRE family protein [Thermoleophilaceae bacterium]
DGQKHDLVFAEGPVVTCNGVVLWSDITFTGVKKGPHGGLRAGNIMRFDPRSGEVSVFRSPSGMSNGLRIDRDCNLLAAEGADYGGQRITRTDMKTGRAEIVAGLYQGRPFNAPNDITTDSKGRIYFSDPRYLELPSGGLGACSRQGCSAVVCPGRGGPWHDLTRPSCASGCCWRASEAD